LLKDYFAARALSTLRAGCSKRPSSKAAAS
jgi:hypothetical protein